MLGLYLKSFQEIYFKMNFLSIGIILVVISEIKCQVSDIISISNDSKIIGGLVIKISDAPYQASIAHKQIFICGASIISTRYLITAAHCKFSYLNII